jgi:hypothetical protein
VRVVDTASRITLQGLTVLLTLAALFAAAPASAQGIGETPASMSMPSLALGLSSSGVQALNDELDEDLRALNANSYGGGRRADRFTTGSFEKPKPWMLYGRLGVFNFQNELDPSRSEGGRITLRKTGPRLTGRYYIGIHRTF